MIPLSLQLTAQSVSTLQDTARIYTEVDVNPKFPGGLKAFDSYIDSNSVKILKADHTSGIVIALVLIERDGKVTMPKIVKSLTHATDSAAIYLLNNSPLWKPAFKNGLPVRSRWPAVVRFNGAQYTQGENNTEGKIIKPKYVEVTVDEPNPQNSVDPKKIYKMYEQAPEFPGGIEKFALYLKQNFNLPPNSNGIKGRVILSFVVELDGSLTDVRVARGLSPDIDKEAIRVISKGPKWHPGIWNSKPVRIAFLTHIDMPINP